MSINTRSVTFSLNSFDNDFKTFFDENLEYNIKYSLFFRFKLGYLYLTYFGSNPITLRITEDLQSFETLLFCLKSDLQESFESYCDSNSNKPDSIELLFVSFKSI